MKFKKYMHVEKLGNSEVENILNGTVYLFYKIDGTNGGIYLADDGQSLRFSSRNRELSLDKDNANFMQMMLEDKEQYNELLTLLQEHPTYIIYGEWLVPHTLKTYKEDAWKHFYVFDVYDMETEKYLSYDVYKALLDNYSHIKYIPLFRKLENPTQEQLVSLLDETGDWLVTSGLSEGIVIKNYDFSNHYGRTVWAKLLTEDFRSKKHDTRSGNKEMKQSDNALEYQISKLLTVEHILKEKSKIEESKGDWQDKYIFELLNRVFIEFWRDNWELILNKFKLPTINFRVLKKLCDEQVKKVLNI